MTKKIVWLLLTGLMVVSLVIAACGPAATPTTSTTPTAPTTPATSPTPTTPTTPTPPVAEKTQQEAVSPDTPKYGGTLTYRASNDPSAWDPYFGSPGATAGVVYESLARENWMTTSRKDWPFTARFAPLDYFAGRLAESWETSDYQTLTFHIRKGVHFQNISPVNGRELTATDIEYTWHRMLGKGSGYTKPSPYVSLVRLDKVDSVTATDKYTVVFKMKSSSMSQLRELLDQHFSGGVVPREAIEKWGDLNNWQRAIGTGPFIMKDYVAGSSITAVRNPDYWGYDERYPENRLPYVDMVKILLLPDNSTADAAMRTGKLDIMDSVAWDRLDSLKRNQNLKQAPIPGGFSGLFVQLDQKPFDDIRVRQALQMSFDLDTLAKTFYGGTVDGTPGGQVMSVYKGFYTEYTNWPQEVKDGYAYNPEGAKKLLTEAGYPNGFKTSVTTQSTYVDLLSIVKDSFSKIGVDMAIDSKETAAYTAYIASGKAVMSMAQGIGTPPLPSLSYFTSAHSLGAPATHLKDADFDALWAKADSSLDVNEQKKLAAEADMYIISHHYKLTLLPPNSYVIYQPWLKGYQNILLTERYGQVFSRAWIDQGLKQAAGR